MKKFKFSLEAALRWRTHVLMQEKVRLQTLETQYERTLRLSETTLRQLTHRPLAPVLEAEALHYLDGQRKYLGRRIAQLQAEAATQKDSINIQRAKCVEADRQCRVLEKLKAAKLAEWTYAVNKKLEEDAADLYNSKLSSRNGP